MCVCVCVCVCVCKTLKVKLFIKQIRNNSSGKTLREKKAIFFLYDLYNSCIRGLNAPSLYVASCVDLQQQTPQVSVNGFLTRYQRGVGHFPPGVDSPARQSYPPQRGKRTGL